MKYVAAFIAFIFMLMAGVPFIGALLLACVAAAIMYFATRGDTGNRGADSRTVADRQAAERTSTQRQKEEDIPDLSDAERFRSYVWTLSVRVRHLEGELAALRARLAGKADPASITRAEPNRVEAKKTTTLDPEEAWQHWNAHEQSPPAAQGDIPQAEAVKPPAADPLPAAAPVIKDVAEPAPAVSAPPAAPAAPLPPASKPRVAAERVRPVADTYRSLGADAGDLSRSTSHVPSPPSPPPPTPQEPAGPSFFSKLVSGNIVAKVGAIVLFFGVGFLLKYAYEHNMISPQLRLLSVAIAAIVVFFIGWKLRAGERRLYGLILQGVASGLAYLDVFFALKAYGFIGVTLGFSLFAILGVATTMLAVRQDAKPLAVLGLTGAFMAPVLASSGGGNVVFLFSYYLLLNLFVLAVSWFKAWRVLNISGWFFSLAVAAVWGARSYTPALFASVEPFLLAFFAIYLVIPILFATRQPPELKGLVDGTLVFGTPAAVATIQARLVWDMPYGLAWSAALGATLYAVLSVVVLRHQNMKLLGQTYIALAVGLGTLAIFYTFGAYTTFALWSIEGAAILWVCLRQNQLLGRLFGMAVQVAGALYFARDYFDYPRFNPWFNDAVLGCIIIAAASFISASMLRRYRERITDIERVLGGTILLWGMAWWSAAGIDVIYYGIETGVYRSSLLILFITASVAAAELIGSKVQWALLRGITIVHPAILLLCAFMQSSFHTAPLADLGALAWPLGLGTLFWVLHRQRRDSFDAGFVARYALAWIILAGVATWQVMWHLEHHEYAYAMGIALIGYASAALRFRLREQATENTRFSTLPMFWATLFWFASGLAWIHHSVPSAYEAAGVILLVTANALVAEFVGTAMSWPALRASSAVHPAMLVVAAVMQLSVGTHPLADFGWLAWPLGMGGLFLTMYRHRRDGVYAALSLRYGTAWLLLAGIATWEAIWWLKEQAYLYAMAIALLGYAIAAARYRLSERGTERVRVSTVVLLWSMFFWFMAGLLWIHNDVARAYEPAAIIAFATTSALLAEFLGALMDWPALRSTSAIHPVLLIVAAFMQLSAGTHPTANYGWLAWALGLGGLFVTLHQQRRDSVHALLSARSVAAWVILAGTATWEALWWIGEREYHYTVITALVGYAIAAIRFRMSERGTDRAPVSTGALLWSMFFWFAAGFLLIRDGLHEVEQVRVALLLVAGSAVVYEIAFKLLQWPAMRMAARLPWIAIPGALALDFARRTGGHPFGGGFAALAWPLSLALAVSALHREEKEGEQFVTAPRHFIALYVPVALLTWEILWWLAKRDFGIGWQFAAFALPASLALLGVSKARGSKRWPLKAHWPMYRDHLLPPAAVALMLWSVAVSILDPISFKPLFIYIPLLNPLDLMVGLAGCAVLAWGASLKDEERQNLWTALSILGFLWINAIALRTIHFWDGVPYRFESLARNVLAQATLSILWTSAALALMLIGRRKMERKFWLAGAALLAVVVGKLFLVDLANTGTVARIVSFLGVGVILLIIGYVAPVPPGVKEARGGGE